MFAYAMFPVTSKTKHGRKGGTKREKKEMNEMKKRRNVLEEEEEEEVKVNTFLCPSGVPSDVSQLHDHAHANPTSNEGSETQHPPTHTPHRCNARHA